MPQCVSEMVQVSNFYLQRGAAKILNKALLKFGRKPKKKARGKSYETCIVTVMNVLNLF